MINNNQKAFLDLVRAGLWEKADANLKDNLNLNDKVDWEKVYQLALQQSVQGLLLQGIEKLRAMNLDLGVPKVPLLKWIGEMKIVEQRNKEMNLFVAEQVEKMREADIYTLLVKGQGVAQCYEKPLWRACGDVDLLLSDSNYQKAKDILLPLSSWNKPDERYSKHLGMSIGEWYVEIHGTLRTGLAERVDKEVDAVQKDVFFGGKVRSWENHGVHVFLPAPDEDVFFVFTHFIKHLYKGGMSLKQVCDWCRLLWTYKESLNHGLLESRIKRAGLVSEWKAFGALAVYYLGMDAKAIPMFDDNENEKFKWKATKLVEFILRGCSGSKVKDTCQIAKIFPWKTLHYSPSIFLNVNYLKIRERLFN